ncbi:spindle pole body formation-associated protein-domain-containing protein [Cadophora sp. MPI-SDFR-AT-0126]|nr:spindle pole body formation-associated protein-domain-containing protein [Leotiomycetes sp. MPI-SDFR-AT-0126]
MLNWWLGRTAEGNGGDDQCQDRDLPETPAPVFAARALKSAIFGAPPPQDDTIYDIETKPRAEASEDVREVQPQNISPTKPSGILLTPGTATTRRKTVSFGNEVVDKDADKKTVEKRITRRRRISDDGEKQASTPLAHGAEELTRAARKTSLTRALEKVREETPKTETTRPSIDSRPEPRKSRTSIEIASKTESVKPKESHQSSQAVSRQREDDDSTELEMTVDLKYPRSQSGKFWKAEYQQYHENALLEMKKVLAYKELAKSYAKHKDAQNIELAKKLNEAQKQVKDMEDKMFELSARITLSGQDGNGDDAPELVKELARQAALGVQYKAQVEEFRAALEGDDDNQNSPSKHSRNRRVPRLSEETDLDAHRELKRLREQLKEMASLKEEISSLRQSFSNAEKSVKKLQDENSKLTQQLLYADLRFEKHLEKCEQKRQSFDEQRHRRDEIVQNLQNDYDRLKEQAKSQRRDAEHLLKKRHDQVVDLKREIASFRGADTNAVELQRVLQEKTAEHDRTVAELQKQIADLKDKQKQDTKDAVSSRVSRDRKPDASSLTSKPLPTVEDFQARESQIPISSQSVSRPSKVLVPSKTSRSETPTGSPMHRSSYSILSEMSNGGNGEPTPFQRSGPVQHTPLGPLTSLTNRFSNLSMDSPEMRQPFSEPSLPPTTSRAVHERNCRQSPGPSMFNIASSPPKAAVVRPRVSNELSRQRSTGNINSRQNANMVSSHVSNLDSSRMRNPIPPERAAAARARLEKKQAEKRRTQALGADKENTPSGL